MEKKVLVFRVMLAWQMALLYWEDGIQLGQQLQGVQKVRKRVR